MTAHVVDVDLITYGEPVDFGRVLSYFERPRIDLQLLTSLVDYYRVFDDPPVSEELVADIEAHGIREPLRIYTNGVTGVLRDGHHRLVAARRLELTSVPVHIVPNWLQRLYDGYPLPPLEPVVSTWLADNLDFTHRSHLQKRVECNKRLTQVVCSCGAHWREMSTEPWERVLGAPRR